MDCGFHHEPSGGLDLANFVEDDAQLVAEVRVQDTLDLLFKPYVAWLESVQHEVPVPDLVFSVLAEHLERLQRVVKYGVPCQNVKTRVKRVSRGKELVNVVKDEKVFEGGDEDRAGVRIE